MLDAIPARYRRFFEGRWPLLWLALGCALVVIVYGLPKFDEANEVRGQLAAQRLLLNDHAALAGAADAEAARHDMLAQWWQRTQSATISARTAELAAARLIDQVRELARRPGLSVTRLDLARTEAVAAGSDAHVALLNLRLEADRMETFAAFLADIEASEGVWLRIGNMTITPHGNRHIEGVQVEAPMYAIVRGTAEG